MTVSSTCSKAFKTHAKAKCPTTHHKPKAACPSTKNNRSILPTSVPPTSRSKTNIPIKDSNLVDKDFMGIWTLRWDIRWDISNSMLIMLIRISLRRSWVKNSRGFWSGKFGLGEFLKCVIRSICTSWCPSLVWSRIYKSFPNLPLSNSASPSKQP